MQSSYKVELIVPCMGHINVPVIILYVNVNRNRSSRRKGRCGSNRATRPAWREGRQGQTRQEGKLQQGPPTIALDHV